MEAFGSLDYGYGFTDPYAAANGGQKFGVVVKGSGAQTKKEGYEPERKKSSTVETVKEWFNDKNVMYFLFAVAIIIIALQYLNIKRIEENVRMLMDILFKNVSIGQQPQVILKQQ